MLTVSILENRERGEEKKTDMKTSLSPFYSGAQTHLKQYEKVV